MSVVILRQLSSFSAISLREQVNFSIRWWWGVLCLRPTRLVGFLYPHSQSGGYTGIPLSVRPSVRPSLNLMYVTSLLLDFIHIWYLGWPWSEHAHIIPISRMVDFCKSYSPFHVCLTIHPFAHLVYATSHLSFCHILFIFGILVGHDLSMRNFTDFTDGWFLREL